MMQGSMSNIVLPGEVFALGTAAFSSDAGTLLDDGRRQVMRIVDTCGGIGHISTGTGHREIFREFKHNGGIMTIFQACVKRNSTTWLLLSHKIVFFDQWFYGTIHHHRSELGTDALSERFQLFLDIQEEELETLTLIQKKIVGIDFHSVDKKKQRQVTVTCIDKVLKLTQEADTVNTTGIPERSGIFA